MCHSAGGTSRASGMLLQYKPMGSQDNQQLRMEVADDKKVASLWLAAMHKVRSHNTVFVWLCCSFTSWKCLGFKCAQQIQPLYYFGLKNK